MPVVTEGVRPIGHHGHHKVAAAVFVGSLILGSALVLAAELTKPARYEYHAGPDPASYLLFDSTPAAQPWPRSIQKPPRTHSNIKQFLLGSKRRTR